MTDTNALLLAAAEHIRALATSAANNLPGDTVCCWAMERIGGHERVIQIRQHPNGTEHDIVALPAEAGVAGHIAAWGPREAQAVAELLDAIADARALDNSRPFWKAVTLAKLLDENRDHEEAP